MSPLIKLLNVSLYKDQAFGIRDVSFELQKYRKYHLILPDTEQLNTVLGLLEGRYRPQSGVVHQFGRIFSQSDRLLLGDKVYSRNAGNFLKLDDEHFFFEERRRSKQTFLHDLKARHIRHFPIYKLRGEDRIKFTLLALTFQESGIMFLSQLLTRQLPDDLQIHLQRIIKGTRSAVCLLSVPDFQAAWLHQLSEEVNLTEISLCRED